MLSRLPRYQPSWIMPLHGLIGDLPATELVDPQSAAAPDGGQAPNSRHYHDRPADLDPDEHVPATLKSESLLAGVRIVAHRCLRGAGGLGAGGAFSVSSRCDRTVQGCPAACLGLATVLADFDVRQPGHM